jgi:RNA polymerase sigma factor (sigma-70 family)
VVSHHWRSRRRFHNLVNRVGGLRQEVSPDPEAQVIRRAEDRRVIEAARRLTETDQEILRLAGWEALPHDEIGSVLGISVAAVDQRFSRAKQRLAKEYDRRSVRPPDVQEGGR